MVDRSVSHPVKSYADQRADARSDQRVVGTTNGNCPRCGSPTMIMSVSQSFGRVMRSRQCPKPNCRHRFTTEAQK
jgi:hypothetical protein